MYYLFVLYFVHRQGSLLSCGVLTHILYKAKNTLCFLQFFYTQRKPRRYLLLFPYKGRGGQKKVIFYIYFKYTLL